jgi:hypothetical protein
MKQSSNSNYFSSFIQTNNKLLNEVMHQTCKITTNDKLKKRVKDILISIIKKDKDNFRKLCYEGMPDELPFLRALVWKINLHYLGFEVDKWEEFLHKKRIEYNDIKSAFLLKMEAQRLIYKEFQEKLNKEITFRENEEMVSIETTVNELDSYMKHTDKQLLEDIDKDISRTHTNMNFFFMPSSKTMMSRLSNEEITFVAEKKRSSRTKSIDVIYKAYNSNSLNYTTFETHADVLSRILYIYAKLNPDLVYVQGMNEIVAPIYYSFSADYMMEGTQMDPEADTFWAFTYFMEEIKCIFLRDKDDEDDGIFGKMRILNELLKIVDRDIYDHFITLKIELSHFAFRWFILFYTQEFLLPDTMRLWDALICETDKFFLVYYVALAILKLKKKELLESDFAEVILHMQELGDVDAEGILTRVNKLKKDYDKKIKSLLSKYKGVKK